MSRAKIRLSESGRWEAKAHRVPPLYCNRKCYSHEEDALCEALDGIIRYCPTDLTRIALGRIIPIVRAAIQGPRTALEPKSSKAFYPLSWEDMSGFARLAGYYADVEERFDDDVGLQHTILQGMSSGRFRPIQNLVIQSSNYYLRTCGDGLVLGGACSSDAETGKRVVSYSAALDGRRDRAVSRSLPSILQEFPSIAGECVQMSRPKQAPKPVVLETQNERISPCIRFCLSDFDGVLDRVTDFELQYLLHLAIERHFLGKFDCPSKARAPSATPSCNELGFEKLTIIIDGDGLVVNEGLCYGIKRVLGCLGEFMRTIRPHLVDRVIIFHRNLFGPHLSLIIKPFLAPLPLGNTMCTTQEIYQSIQDDPARLIIAQDPSEIPGFFLTKFPPQLLQNGPQHPLPRFDPTHPDATDFSPARNSKSHERRYPALHTAQDRLLANGNAGPTGSGGETPANATTEPSSRQDWTALLWEFELAAQEKYPNLVGKSICLETSPFEEELKAFEARGGKRVGGLMDHQWESAREVVKFGISQREMDEVYKKNVQDLSRSLVQLAIAKRVKIPPSVQIPTSVPGSCHCGCAGSYSAGGSCIDDCDGFGQCGGAYGPCGGEYCVDEHRCPRGFLRLHPRCADRAHPGLSLDQLAVPDTVYCQRRNPPLTPIQEWTQKVNLDTPERSVFPKPRFLPDPTQTSPNKFNQRQGIQRVSNLFHPLRYYESPAPLLGQIAAS